MESVGGASSTHLTWLEIALLSTRRVFYKFDLGRKSILVSSSNVVTMQKVKLQIL